MLLQDPRRTGRRRSSCAVFCCPPVKGGGEPQANGGLVFGKAKPPARKLASPLIRGAKTTTHRATVILGVVVIRRFHSFMCSRMKTSSVAGALSVPSGSC